jgi:hypothetical protein
MIVRRPKPRSNRGKKTRIGPPKKTPSRSRAARSKSSGKSNKGLPVKRPNVEKVSEVDFVRETLLNETGAHFEVIAPHPAFPIAVDKLEWFMRCRNREEITRAPYVNAVWKEKGDRFWFESLAIGDTIEWIELAYGEERATQSLDMDYSAFEEPSFQMDFRRKFPVVLDRIREYEGIAARVSKSRGVHLELRRSGARGMLVFTFAVRLDMPQRATLKPLGSAISKSVSALKEVYEEITKL